ncbi:MAG: hypothetical protein ACPLTR_08225 [Thermacetogeniaceae bacterium]
MSLGQEERENKGFPPGVCVPWEEKLKELGTILGNEEIIKSEWEKLDAFAYIYLWWWVQR